MTPGIESAKAMKADGVTIYSVGLFPSADGYHADEISYDVTANGQGTEGFFTNANCFLHLVSSNYPDATGVAAGEQGSLSNEYVEDKNSFYLGTSDATQLAGIFEQISEEVTPGSTTVTLDETAIMKDKITNGMPEIVAGNVTLTGSQALAHARNRSLDNDFGRTERQRDVIYGIYNKVLEQRNNPATLMSLIKFCMTQVSTNMSVTELYEMATEVLSVDNLKTQQAAIPAEGTYEFGTYEDMSVLNIDLEANKEYIQELLY